ncbi:MAG: sensor histidine kinase [Dehalococcoidia bacterium]|nr:sensor histidine kinase [Dehalococcoidia bacterium]
MDGFSDVFKDNIVAVYFLHGLALFLMGVLVTRESRRSLATGLLPRVLAPLGIFGIIAGMSEWLEMFTAIPRSTAGPDVGLLLHQIQPSNCLECHPGLDQADNGLLASGDWARTLAFVLFLCSLFFLIHLGQRLLQHTGIANPMLRYLPLAMTAIWLAATVAYALIHPSSFMEWRGVATIYYRYLLYLPGAMLVSIGLWRLNGAVLKEHCPRGGTAARLLAGLFALSGVFDGLIVRPATFPPASLLNYASFFQLIGIPVQLFRAAIVVAIAYWTVQLLKEWDMVQTRKVTEALQERLRLQQDATETETRQRMQAEHWNRELQKERELRGEVLKRIITAQENERKRVARELHDEMGQTLTGLATGLEAVMIAIDKDPRTARSQLGRLQEFAQLAVADVHRLINDLRPALLDDLGLASALRWYANLASEQGGFAIQVDTSRCDRRLPPHLETILFRIAQEALTNVVRHAGAKSLEIKLSCDSDVILEVMDDGRGFDVQAKLDQSEGREAVGLLGMRERALLAGGMLDLISRPGGGCRIIASLPITL